MVKIGRHVEILWRNWLVFNHGWVIDIHWSLILNGHRPSPCSVPSVRGIFVLLIYVALDYGHLFAWSVVSVGK